MSVQQIKAFAESALNDSALAEQLKACQKVRELLALSQASGFAFAEDALYPPNEPQFREEQLSERLVKALLRA